MSVEDMLKSVVIASANDCAVALAEFVSGSESAFVDAMNARAAELGMKNTHFENTNGLDDTVENHVTSARDIAIMSRALISHPKILEYSSTWMDTIREGAFGLGAGKWRVIRTVVLPGCMDGVVTGCILSVGRILGESAALLFTAGFAHAVNGIIDGLSAPGATLTVALYVYAKEQGEFDVAFAIAAMLMVLTVLINLAAALVQKYFAKRRSL